MGDLGRRLAELLESRSSKRLIPKVDPIGFASFTRTGSAERGGAR